MKESLIRLQLQRLKLLRHDGRSYEGEDLRKKISRELGFYHGPMLRVFREELDKAGPDDESSVGKSEDSIIFERTKQRFVNCPLTGTQQFVVRGERKASVPSGAGAEEGGYLPPLQAECQMRS